MDLEIRVVEILLKLAAQVNGRMLQLGNLNPGMMLPLLSSAEVLDDVVCVLSESPIDFHSSVGVRL